MFKPNLSDNSARVNKGDQGLHILVGRLDLLGFLLSLCHIFKMRLYKLSSIRDAFSVEYNEKVHYAASESPSA